MLVASHVQQITKYLEHCFRDIGSIPNRIETRMDGKDTFERNEARGEVPEVSDTKRFPGKMCKKITVHQRDHGHSNVSHE